MKSPLILSLLLIVSFFKSFSQDVSVEGLIVLQSGDTIKGRINDLEWFKTPESIQFRKNGELNFQTFSPKEIKAFATARPVSYEVHAFKYDGDMLGKTSVSYTSKGDVPTTRLPLKWIEDTTFVEVIAKGKLSLYNYADADGRSHFLIQEDEKPLEELIYRKYASHLKGVAIIATSNEYKQQLTNLAGDCPSAKNRLQNCSYDESRLKKMIELLNSCKGSNLVVNKSFKPNHKKSDFGLLFQPQLTQAKSQLAVLSFDKPSYQGGITYEIYSKKRPNRQSFYSELKYMTVSQEGELGYASVKKPATFKYRSFKMVNTFRSSFGEATNIYLNFGILNGMRFDTSIKPVQKIGYKVAKGGSAFISGLAIGIGKRIPKLNGSIEIRYEIERAFVSDNDQPNRLQSVGVVAGFHF
jgi:hypothetical protein